MIPSNVDSRRSDKVQRYKPSQANGNAPGDDLTPDYMNILVNSDYLMTKGEQQPTGPESTTANAEAPNEMTEEQRPEQPETWPTVTAISMSETPISPKYGISNLPPTTNDIPSDTTTPATDTITETTAKSSDGDNKDLHSTPSRNDRFKVVKIASLEPFRRGRWKCMDYVDQTTPATTTTIKSTQSTGTVPLYMHTQSLPQQQIQQMLLQGGLPYFNIPFPTVSPNQYFYSAQPISNIPTQTLQQQIGVVPGNVQPPVFISTTQPYIQQNVPNSVAGFSVQSYPNAQYVPSNLSQNQNSAFIPTSQNVSAQMSSSFQPSQTFAGQPTVSQPNIGQPIVNGHAFPQQNDQVSSTLPTQVAKIAILNSQPPNIQQNQVPQSMAIPTNQPQQIQAVPVQAVLPNQQYNQQIQNANYQQVNQISTQINQGNQQQIPQNINQIPVNVTAINPIPTSNPSVSQIPTVQTTVNQIPTSASQVVSVNPIQQQMNPIQSTNIQSVPQIVPQIIPILPAASMQPQFVTSVSNLVSADTKENHMEGNREVPNTISEISSDNASNEDISKPTNPVAPQVNAIDNKIEQAMDLVKSHLMYTVREEVEILKEKITELMAKIQQLESENSYLKTQIPNLNPNGIPDPPQ